MDINLQCIFSVTSNGQSNSYAVNWEKILPALCTSAAVTSERGVILDSFPILCIRWSSLYQIAARNCLWSWRNHDFLRQKIFMTIHISNYCFRWLRNVPTKAAIWAGVLPSVFVAWLFAPADSNFKHTSRFPDRAAKCSDVYLCSCCVSLTLAP